jgi:hypothetical protein
MINYVPTASGEKYHDSDDPIKLIMGPFGSGKSTICAMDILYSACAQTPDADGVRWSRWGVVRASYPNLVDTTRKILMEIMPEGSGTITRGNAPLHGVFEFPLKEKGGGRTLVHAEFELWSALTEEDADKFRSANWTGAWLNEATEVESGVFSAVMARSGRFPVGARGACRWGGVLLDFNRPRKGSWLEAYLNKAEIMINTDEGVESTKICTVVQPPAAFKIEDDGEIVYRTNPEAENLNNLKGGVGYYERLIAIALNEGRTNEVDALYCMLEAVSNAGRPVWPMFSVKKHVAVKRLEPLSDSPLIIGCDTSGIHPAAVLLQFQQGRWCATDELYGEQEGLDVFLNSGLIPLVKGKYPRCPVVISCDPANARDSYTGRAPTDYLQRAGFSISLPTTNRTAIRVAAVSAMLNVDVGGFMVSPHCENLIEAMLGTDGDKGYHFARHRLRGSVSVVYSETPEKNEGSHLADALQYAVLYITRESRTSSPEFAGISRGLLARNRKRRKILAA